MPDKTERTGHVSSRTSTGEVDTDVPSRDEDTDVGMVSPLFELVRSEVNRAVIDWVIETGPTERWFRTGDIADELGVARESLRRQVSSPSGHGPLVLFGLLEPKHDDAAEMPNIPHYRPAHTDVTAMLREWDGYPLTELFTFNGAQRLVEFYLLDADRETAYSYRQLHDEGGIGYDAASDHIETLHEAGLVEEVERPRTTGYRLDTDSDMFSYLYELNNLLYDHVADE